MNTVLEAPATTSSAPPPRPRRSRAARTLTWVGGVLGALLVVWSALAVASVVARQETSGQATFAAAGTVELVADGHVTVHAAEPGAPDEVRVERSARYAFADPRWSVQEPSDGPGDRLVVSYRCAWASLWSCDTALDVTVPAGTSVVVRTTDGAVQVSGVSGPVDLHTADGAVDATDLGGDLRVVTSNGSVDASGVAGAVTATSSDGDVAVRGAASVDARTSNGGIDVEDVSGTVVTHSSDGDIQVADARADVTATTSNGQVTVHGTGKPVALDMDTSNGRTTLEAPTDPAAAVHVRIRSSNGDVSYLGPRG